MKKTKTTSWSWLTAGFLALAATAGAQTLTNGLIFHAPFNNSLNDVAGGRTGTGFNSPTLVSSGGVGGGGFVQLANDSASPKQAVYYADPTPASNDFTFQIWVRAADAASAQNGQTDPDMAIAANKDWGAGGNVGWVLAREDGNQGDQFQWNMNTANGSRKDFDPRNPAATVFDGSWHQLVVTYQRTNVATFFVDGRAIGTVNISANAGSMRPAIGNWVTNNILALGEDATLQYWHGSGSALNGDLDESAMWDRVLSPTDVLTAYVKGKQSVPLDTPLAPSFVQQPQGGVRYASDNFLLSPRVAGDRGPLTFQWYKDGAAVTGATNVTYLVTTLGTASANYTLVVNDGTGSITSAPAAVTIISTAKVTDGMAVYLNFDDNLAGQSGTTVNGSPIGADPNPKYVAGAVGKAVTFNNDASASGIPSDWAVSLGDLENVYSNNWSFSLWVNLTNNLDGALLGNKDWNAGGNVGWAFAPYNNVEVNYFAQGGPRRDLGVVSVRDGQWHQVSAIFNRDANRVDLYVDGALSTSSTLSQSGWESLTPANVIPNDTLVGSSGPGPYSGAGSVDDLGIWKRLLTPAEVLAIYAKGREGKPLTEATTTSGVAPTISTAPVSISVFEGRRLALSVSAAGTAPLSYQWYRNGVAIPDQTNATYSVASSTTNNAGSYTVVVANSYGSVTSTPPAVVQVQSVANISAGLAVYLNFDNNINAQGGTTNNGTAIGATANPVYTPGRIGSSAMFNNDGSGSFIPSDWAVSLGDIEWIYARSWTFAMWVNATNGNDGALIGNKDWDSGGNIGWLYVPTRANSLNYTAQGGARHDVGGVNTLTGTWRHIAAVFDRDANQVSYYIDGSLVVRTNLANTGTESLTPTDVVPNDTLVGSSGPGRWAGAGAVDDLGIWYRPLSADEILAIYVQGVTGHPLTTASASDLKPLIVTQPAATTRPEGLPALFTVQATGSGTLGYQWYKNGQPISGATGTTLSYIPLTGDSGATFTVIITNAFGAVSSAPPAQLTVIAAPGAITNGLAVYLNFDSNILAQAGTTVNGTVLGNNALEKYAPGVIGAAASFNNDDSDSPTISDWAVSLGDIEWVYTNSFSFALWIKTTDTYGALLGNKNWYSGLNVGWCVSRYYVDWLNYRPEGAPRHDIGAFDWADNTWHHVAAVFYREGNTVYTFVDGNLTATAPLGVTGQESLTPTDILQTLVGSSGGGNESAFGLVDDLAIWNRAVGQPTLQDIYQSGRRGVALPLATHVAERPSLTATLSGADIVLTFPASAAGQTIQATTSLTSPSWTTVSASVQVNGDIATARIPVAAGTRFFRLSQ